MPCIGRRRPLPTARACINPASRVANRRWGRRGARPSGFTRDAARVVTPPQNYLYLAASKLRTCAIGPELVVDGDFDLVPGEVSVDRGERVLWSREIRTGESAMCHSLSNIEHHHFKLEFHRRPGDLHIHFFGADAFSFGDGVRLEDG